MGMGRVEDYLGKGKYSRSKTSFNRVVDRNPISHRIFGILLLVTLGINENDLIIRKCVRLERMEGLC